MNITEKDLKAIKSLIERLKLSACQIVSAEKDLTLEEARSHIDECIREGSARTPTPSHYPEWLKEYIELRVEVNFLQRIHTHYYTK